VAVLRVLLPVLLLQVVEVRAHLVHKLLLLVLLQAAVVVAVVVLVQGLVASESLRSR
jgi:hypothetical protein